MTTQTSIKYVGSVPPGSLSEQLDTALRQMDPTVAEYDVGTLTLTGFTSDVEPPFLASGTAQAYVSFHGGEMERARVEFETRRESGDPNSAEFERTEIVLRIRRFHG